MTFLFSNSSTKLWHTCKRLFYLTQLYLGRGISTKYVDEDLLFGTIIHELMPWLWDNGRDDDDTERRIKDSRQQVERTLLMDVTWLPLMLGPQRTAKAAEWGRLFEGMCWGLVVYVLPRLRRTYKMFAAEGDAVAWIRQANQPRIGLIAKPDTLVEGDGVEVPPGLGYIEWKTTADKSQKWFAQWNRNPQTWTGAITLKSSLGLDIEWFIVVGFYKGVERDGMRYSPFCWAYSDGKAWSEDGTTKKGWERTSTDEFPGGVRQWVKNLTDEKLREQFVETLPVTIDWDLADEWLANQKPLLDAVEACYDLTKAVQRDEITDQKYDKGIAELFPRELSMCDVGPYNKPCVMREMCHTAVGKDPLGSGKYKQREPHHPLEKKYWEE